MKVERTSATVIVLALGGALGCTAYPTLKSVPVSCGAEAAYELQVVDAFDTVGTAGFWTSADTAGAAIVPTPAPVPYVVSKVEAISDAPRCGSTAALVIRSERNNDWGSLAGIDIKAPRDESVYEGLSFWARAPGNTTKGFTILFGDANTSCLNADPDGGVCLTQPSNCITYAAADGGTGTGVTDGTGMLLPGTVTTAPEPNQCGNVYSVVRVVTGEWAFYTIPFSEFQQGALPNRVPNAELTQTGPVPGTALLTHQLLSLTIRMPKEAVMELWIDNLSFYRKATGAGGGDGGVDAPQM